jgi:4-aminobutyrate aminotransferase-like enzyme
MSKKAEKLMARRRRALGPSYSHFYAEPLYLVRGEDVWLYDQDGRRYLDCYNNVPSVGHCHPEVVATLARQAGTLNTHTRYLHHAIVEYAEMLADTLPGDLSACSFVCTGTEANDLAYRIARSVTGNDGAIMTTDAYHGNSTLVAELSRPYECERPLPDFVVDAEPPYTYRGPFNEDHPDFANAYADLVDVAIDKLAGKGHKPAMMIIDSIYDGKFMDSGVVPDIVTMGKPMGDGHPLAVVVTTPDIASRFAKDTGYFNTFGGNPVSAEVGKKVLEIVLRDDLLTNVKETGDHLLAGLRKLAAKHELIGEVRGKGFFIGIELVTDRQTKTPAERETSTAIELMRESGVLVSRIGRYRNILKIRPPLTFRREHADIVLEKLDAALTRVA